MSQALYDLLAEHLTERKRNLFNEVVSNRTRHITLVMEDIYQAQNASALFRSLESWGIQDVHVIENIHSLNLHRRVAKGAYDWLTMHRYNNSDNNTIACLSSLKEKGYRIMATSLNEEAIEPNEIDLTHKTAIVLGTELTGISEEVKSHCDGFVKIPMYGFTESLNVSVAGGVIMQYLAQELRKQNIDWQLSASEQLALKIEWAKKTIYWSQHLIDLFESGEIK